MWRVRFTCDGSTWETYREAYATQAAAQSDASFLSANAFWTDASGVVRFASSTPSFATVVESY